MTTISTDPISDAHLFAIDDYWCDHVESTPDFWKQSHFVYNNKDFYGQLVHMIPAGTFYLPAGPWVTITRVPAGIYMFFSKAGPSKQDSNPP